MKKIVSFLTLGVICLYASFAAAYTYTYPGTSLDHYYADLWGIELDLASDEVITGVTLSFSSIYNYDGSDNDLWVSLVDEGVTLLGVETFYDRQDPINYFLGSGFESLEIGHFENIVGPSRTGSSGVDLEIVFDTDMISFLKESITDDNLFGIGLDADCHYYFDSIVLTINTTTYENEVPEPATMLLFGTGLAGLAGFRRRMNKQKK